MCGRTLAAALGNAEHAVKSVWLADGTATDLQGLAPTMIDSQAERVRAGVRKHPGARHGKACHLNRVLPDVVQTRPVFYVINVILAPDPAIPEARVVVIDNMRYQEKMRPL